MKTVLFVILTICSISYTTSFHITQFKESSLSQLRSETSTNGYVATNTKGIFNNGLTIVTDLILNAEKEIKCAKDEKKAAVDTCAAMKTTQTELNALIGAGKIGRCDSLIDKDIAAQNAIINVNLIKIAALTKAINGAKATTKFVPCAINEAKNAKGPNQCSKSSQCEGDRTCSGAGWCQGTSNCDVTVTIPAPNMDAEKAERTALKKTNAEAKKAIVVLNKEKVDTAKLVVDYNKSVADKTKFIVTIDVTCAIPDTLQKRIDTE